MDGVKIRRRLVLYAVAGFAASCSGGGGGAPTAPPGSSPGATTLTLQASPIAIPRDGRATLIATLLDGSRRPMQGVAVALTTSLGTLDNPAPMSDAFGHAIATLKGGGAEGRAHLSAQASGTSATGDLDIGQGLTLVLAAAPPAIDASGSTTLSLLATSADLRPVPIGTAVTFTTSLGSLDVAVSTVEETGYAHTVLRAARKSGTAHVTAQVAGFAERATVDVPVRP
jgi:hypothetical protein